VNAYSPIFLFQISLVLGAPAGLCWVILHLERIFNIVRSSCSFVPNSNTAHNIIINRKPNKIDRGFAVEREIPFTTRFVFF